VEKFDGPSKNLIIFSDTIHVAVFFEIVSNVLLSETSSADCVKLYTLTLSSSTCSGSLSGLLPAEAPSYSSRTRTNGVPNNKVFSIVNLLSSSRLSKAFPGLSVLQEYQRAECRYFGKTAE
jgi:hypothetical protein